ncbi:MAG: response regulator transcription factor [Aurantimonas endophytica]|uniref:response regulator transcription factor n=1 Tax=Aurantimonas endophytica TaxID=1522175 RepID=UPI0030033D33
MAGGRMPLALIIDDHPIVVTGFMQTVGATGVCDVVGSISLVEGFRTYRQRRPDVIVLDLSFRDDPFAGLSFLRRFRALGASTPILVFSMHDDPTIVRQVLHVGANGYVQKDVSPEVIREAFLAVLAGSSFLMPEMASKVALLNQPRDRGLLDRLTSREMEILGLISRGHSYTDISSRLGISYKTVANTSSILKTKLSARSLPELMIKSIRLLS